MTKHVGELPTREKVVELISRAEDLEWNVQGYGMFRHDISSAIRLHMWNPNLARINVMDHHAHHFHFVSRVYCGMIENRRFVPDFLSRSGLPCDTTPKCTLVHIGTGYFRAGETYSQAADIVHQAIALPGTVSAIYRDFLVRRPPVLLVYPLAGRNQVANFIRPATRDEIIATRDMALQRFELE